MTARDNDVACLCVARTGEEGGAGQKGRGAEGVHEREGNVYCGVV
jgi:hypothetical protein